MSTEDNESTQVADVMQDTAPDASAVATDDVETNVKTETQMDDCADSAPSERNDDAPCCKNDPTDEQQKEEEQQQKEHKQLFDAGDDTVPFLDKEIDLRGKSAAEMKALLESLVDEVSDAEIQAQKDAHDKEILDMQELMMEANKDGLLDEDDGDAVEELDEDGNVKQSAEDGSIMLKNTSGTHNPILDDLRKKQMRGQLSKEEEVLLAKVIDYQRRMTGAVGASDEALAETVHDSDATSVVSVQKSKSHGVADIPFGQTGDGCDVYLFELPFDIFSSAVRGTTMPLVPAGASKATLAGNSLVTSVRISLLNNGAGVANDTTFVLGTIRGGHAQDPDNKPQRWVDAQNPMTVRELKQNRGIVDIECNANDVVFNPAMVGITVLKGDLPKNSLSVCVLTVALDEDEEVPVGAFGPASSATNGTSAKQPALLAAQQRQQQKKTRKDASKPLSALQKAVHRQTVAPLDTVVDAHSVSTTSSSSLSTQKGNSRQPAVKRVAPSVRRLHAGNGHAKEEDDDDEDEEYDPLEAADDETHTLKPQLPPGSENLPTAPTRKQLAADPNNPKFDPQPVKERLNRFSTNENGESLAPDLPPGVAGYAADGTVIPIVNDGDQFNPQIPDVFGDRDHRNHVMSSQYEPEKDKPMFFNPKIKYAVVTVIGPKHCRIKTDRCVARVWGFAKNKKQCGTISKWVRGNAYMGKIWDLGVVPIDTWWPVPPIYAENATSTYSNPLHREYMEAYLNEQKRATVELEQRVLDERLNSQKKGNTISKQLSRQEAERRVDGAQQGKRPAPAVGASAAQQSGQIARPRRAPVTQRIK